MGFVGGYRGADPKCILVSDGFSEFEGVDDERRDYFSNLKKAVQAARTRVLIISGNEFDIETALHSSATELGTYMDSDCKVLRDDVKDDKLVVSLRSDMVPSPHTIPSKSSTMSSTSMARSVISVDRLLSYKKTVLAPIRSSIRYILFMLRYMNSSWKIYL